MTKLPKTWEELEFSKCVKKISIKHKIKTKNYLKNGKYPIIDQSQDFISGYFDDEKMLIKTKKPLIVFGDHTRCFKFIDFDFIAGADGIKILEPVDKFNHKCFYYFCLALKFENKGYSRHYQYLEKAIMRIPPIDTQKQIVELLDFKFAKIENATNALNLVKKDLVKLKASLLNSAFNGTLLHDNDLQALSHDDTASNLPQDWEVKTLGEVLSKDKHSMKRGPFGSALKKEFFVNSGVRVFEQYNPINQDSEWKRYFISQEKFQELKDFKAGAGDLLISCSGTFGKILELPENVEEGIINQALLKIKLDNSQILNKYFIFLFNSPYMQNIISESTLGTAIKNMASVKDLKKIKIPLPPLNTQKQIVEILESKFKGIEKLEHFANDSLDKLSKLKASLLNKAFSGELVC